MDHASANRLKAYDDESDNHLTTIAFVEECMALFHRGSYVLRCDSSDKQGEMTFRLCSVKPAHRFIVRFKVALSLSCMEIMDLCGDAAHAMTSMRAVYAD